MRLQRVKETNGLMMQAHHWPSGYIRNTNMQVAEKSTPSPLRLIFSSSGRPLRGVLGLLHVGKRRRLLPPLS